MHLSLADSKKLLLQCRKGILRPTRKELIHGGTCLVQTSHIDADGSLRCTTNLVQEDLKGSPDTFHAQPVNIMFINRAKNIYLFVVGKLQLVTTENNPIELAISVTTSSAYCMEKTAGQVNILQPLEL